MTETSPVLLRLVSLTLYSVWVELAMAGGALHCNQSDSLSEADALFLALFWVMNGRLRGLILSTPSALSVFHNERLQS